MVPGSEQLGKSPRSPNTCACPTDAPHRRSLFRRNVREHTDSRRTSRPSFWPRNADEDRTVPDSVPLENSSKSSASGRLPECARRYAPSRYADCTRVRSRTTSSKRTPQPQTSRCWPRATRFPVTRRVGAVKPIKNMRQIVRRDASAAVGDTKGNARRLLRQRHTHLTTWRCMA